MDIAALQAGPGEAGHRIRPEEAGVLRALLASGLPHRLGATGLCLPFHLQGGAGDLALVAPQVPFRSYPYEWTFSALKEAALVTLRVHLACLERGYALKEASSFHLQSLDGRMVHAHALGFGTRDSRPAWAIYHQFCRHFLAPLALMAARDPRLGKLLAVHGDGIPLDLARGLLPWKAWFKPGVLLNLVVHDWLQPGTSPFAARHARNLGPALERLLVNHLLGTLASLELPAPARDTWHGYMDDCGYGRGEFAAKEAFVSAAVEGARPRLLWDFGANIGHFSRLVAPMAGMVVALDADPWASEANGRLCRKHGVTNVLPLVMDLANPSPALGWGGSQRLALAGRGPCGMGLVLALVHHLTLSAGIPFAEQARFFGEVCGELVVEFPERNDDRTGRMLAQRLDGAPWYCREAFEEAYLAHFELIRAQDLAPRHRRIYHLRRRAHRACDRGVYS